MRPQHWLYTIPLRLRSLFRRHDLEQELNEELQFHLEQKIAQGIAKGLSLEEARYAAMRSMEWTGTAQRGNTRCVGHSLVDGFLRRCALRHPQPAPHPWTHRLRSHHAGAGNRNDLGNIQHGRCTDFQALPCSGSGQREVTLVSTTHDSNFDAFSYREYLDICPKTNSYAGVIAYADMQPVGFTAEPATTPRIKGGMLVSGNYFPVLGVEPRLGRGFCEDEDQEPGRDAVVVLGPDFWNHEFASDPAILGKTVRLDGTEFTVIGVAPDSFPGLLIFGHPDFYVPLAMARVFSTNLQKNFFEDRDDRELNIKARLKPGTTQPQARNELAVLAKNFEREYPKVNRNRGAAVYTPVRSARTRERSQLEIRRHLSDLGVGRPSGGLHQRCGTPSLSRARRTHSRDRRALGHWRRPFPPHPPALD